VSLASPVEPAPTPIEKRELESVLGAVVSTGTQVLARLTPSMSMKLRAKNRPESSPFTVSL
jgi:hypothetical protein